MDEWRLLVDGYLTPAENMARDEVLLRRVIAGASSPCLRFYRWKPPGLSIGRFQKVVNGVDLGGCRKHGVKVVRRLTGGEAVLHDDELTYSIIVPVTQRKFERKGVVDTYRVISRTLVRGLELAGLSSTMAGEAPTRPDPAGQGICFYTPTVYEIVAGGRKIIGSAQTREMMTILQHGSVPIDWDVSKLFDVTGIPEEERDVFENLFRSHATTIREQMGRRVEFPELVKCFTKGFSEVFDMEPVPSKFALMELKMAERLVGERYGNDEWNLKL